MHPFYNECRAYGRLKEAGKEHLAVLCYGYRILDARNKAALREKFPDIWDAEFQSNESNAGKPLLVLVKEFRESTPNFGNRRGGNDWIKVCLGDRKTGKTLHHIGILCRDIGGENVVNGKFLEFSCAMTVPHPCLDSAHIESSAWYSHLDGRLGYWDAEQVDELIDSWNAVHPTEQISTREMPNAEYTKCLRSYHPDYSPTIAEMGWKPRPDKYKWKPEDTPKQQTTKARRKQPRERDRRKQKKKQRGL